MKKSKIHQFEYMNNIPLGFISNGFSQGGFSGNEKQSNLGFVWILSGASPSSSIRGVWTEDGVWKDTAVWLG